MAWAYRASSYANNGLGVSDSTSPGTGGTFAIGTALSAGDLIVLSIMGFNTTTNNSPPTFAVSDTVNGSWGSRELETVTFAIGTSSGRASLWAFENTGAGTPTFTITKTWAGGSGCSTGAQAAAFSGMVTTAPLDTGVAATGNNSSPASGNVSPATGAASELMVGCYVDAGYGTTLGAGNINAVGATLAGKHDADSGRWQGLFEYGDSGSSGGTPAATVTDSGTSVWGMIAAVFKITGAAAVIPPGLGPVVQMDAFQTYVLGW